MTDSTHDLTPERSEQISQIIAEFSEVFAFVRTRWARFAEETHPDLRGSGIMVLQVVLRKGPVTVTGLSQLLDIDKAMVSRQISKLRDLGLVASEPAAEDRRVTLITATDKARETIEKLRARAAHDYHLRFAQWDDAALMELGESLHRFNSYSPEHADGPAVRCARGHGGGAEASPEPAAETAPAEDASAAR
ncbi:MarR family winged helix-turn-helix transcriptional regulator [Leucobacter sp. HY1908]